MEQVIVYLRDAAAMAAEWLSNFLGADSAGFIILLNLTIADFIVFFIIAVRNKKISFRAVLEFAFKKICCIAIVGVAHSIDTVTKTDLLHSLATHYFIAFEGVSIIEAMDELGIPLPKQLTTSVKSFLETEMKELTDPSEWKELPGSGDDEAGTGNSNNSNAIN